MRLLIVEDDEGVAEPLAAALALHDPSCTIVHAKTLDQALAEAARDPFDAALVDLNLPDASSCDAAIALRLAAPDLPLVAFTGESFDAVGMQLIREGVQDFLQKGADSVDRIHRALQLAVERERQKSQLKRSASYDDLTGVLNRREFVTQLEKSIARAGRDDRLGSLLLLDIDNFKQINDTHGHQFGDEVLRELTRRLTAMVRSGDSVGRFGGDEFMILITGLSTLSDVDAVCRKLHDGCSGALPIAGRDCLITVSMGAAVFPTDSSDAAELFSLADEAMYRAKNNGKAAFRRFHQREPGAPSDRVIYLKRRSPDQAG